MTTNHDHASLFRAADGPAAESVEDAGQVAEAGAEAMRQLRDPFAVQPPATPEDAKP
ncbi:hypothetical protein Ais01nite_05440 [Asanoa ishikariensis]|uniref:Uncharacterized protein n=1 Tax=Asanoa ishikariensis TaxID=137265 RepID=A0A1H3TFR5_9ACTN|nr:hypothetical protein [Asanoa ishikariensis]GIF62509.1 hypothetical protein Ais01nite_05440 [Asanoa ishikariensis]SDZ49133.1 hypothetical protein SAMN05421684_5689 [Asanoa ishikariensis]